MAKKRARSKKAFWYILFGAAVILSILLFLSNQNPKTTTVKIYFFRGSKAVPVKRDMPEKADVLYFVTEQLLRGPDQAEKRIGLFSRIPARTKIRDIYKKNGTVYADFSKELNVSGGGTEKVKDMLFQIVYTFTGLQGVKNVQILVDSKMQVALGSEGYVIEKPLSRDDVSAK